MKIRPLHDRVLAKRMAEVGKTEDDILAVLDA